MVWQYDFPACAMRAAPAMTLYDRLRNSGTVRPNVGMANAFTNGSANTGFSPSDSGHTCRKHHAYAGYHAADIGASALDSLCRQRGALIDDLPLTSAAFADNTQTRHPRRRRRDLPHVPSTPISSDIGVARRRQHADGLYAPAAPAPTCQLWQLQAVMTAAQWTAAQNAVAALNNPAVSAFFAHGTNVIPANSTTLLSLGTAIGLTAAQITALVQQASAVSIP